MSKNRRQRGISRGQIIGLAVACVGIAVLIGGFVLLRSKNNGGKDGSVDIDLSVMSATVVSGQLQQMTQSDPGKYLGQTVKARGKYGAMTANGTTYYSCTFPGSGGCCPNGLEFKYSGTKKPKSGQTIEIIGEYSKYNEGSQVFYYIQVTKMTVV